MDRPQQVGLANLISGSEEYFVCLIADRGEILHSFLHSFCTQFLLCGFKKRVTKFASILRIFTHRDFALRLHSILLHPCLSGYVFDPPNLKTDDLTFLKEFTDGLAVFLTPDDRKETVDWIFQLDGKIIVVIFLL